MTKEIPISQYESSPLGGLAEQMISSRHFEITGGFPVKTADDFRQLTIQLQKRGVSRLPIMGTKDGRVFLLATNREGEKNSHEELLKNIHADFNYSEEDLLFTTSVEAMSLTPPGRLHLSLNTERGVRYAIIGTGSDKLNVQLKNGIQVLTRIFGSIEGLSIKQ